MNNKLIIVVFAFCIAALAIAIWSKFSAPKIAYVRSADLFEKYIGMKEAKNVYKNKMNNWQSNIDTLQSDYQRAISQYQTDLPRLSKSEKSQREDQLKKQQLNLQQYIKNLEGRAKEEDAKMTEGVVNQINSYVKDYGQEHGYEVILGITVHGNILYGKNQIDITDDILNGLNESYKSTGAEK